MDNLTRLHALNSYQALDTLPQEDMDEITRLAATICGTPISLITFFDTDRQWFKSKQGVSLSQMRLEHSLCQCTIQTPEQLLIIEDVLFDDRFKNDLLATSAPFMRFYAGAPLVTSEGRAIGSLCVMDYAPRSLTEQQQSALSLLSKQVVKQLGLRKAHKASERQHKANSRRLLALSEQSPDFIAVLDDSLKITYANRGYEGVNRDKFLNMPIIRVIGHAYRKQFVEQCKSVFQTKQSCKSDLKIIRNGGSLVWVNCRMAPLRDENGQVFEILLICRDISVRKEAEENNLKQIKSLETMMFMISHQLRSPICSMLGIAPLLKQPDISLEEKLQYFRHIYDAVLKMDGFTRELSLFIDSLRLKK